MEAPEPVCRALEGEAARGRCGGWLRRGWLPAPNSFWAAQGFRAPGRGCREGSGLVRHAG